MKIGQSEFDFYAPDLVVMRVAGIVDEAVAAQGGDAIVAFALGGRIFLLSDMRVVGGHEMTGAARKAFVEHMQGVTLVAVAVIGASFHVRVVSLLLNTAMRMLNRHSPQIEFFDAEPGARAWLAQRGCRSIGSSPH